MDTCCIKVEHNLVQLAQDHDLPQCSKYRCLDQGVLAEQTVFPKIKVQSRPLVQRVPHIPDILDSEHRFPLGCLYHGSTTQTSSDHWGVRGSLGWTLLSEVRNVGIQCCIPMVRLQWKKHRATESHYTRQSHAPVHVKYEDFEVLEWSHTLTRWRSHYGACVLSHGAVAVYDQEDTVHKA